MLSLSEVLVSLALTNEVSSLVPHMHGTPSPSINKAVFSDMEGVTNCSVAHSIELETGERFGDFLFCDD